MTASRLRSIRTAWGLSQEVVAHRAGLTTEMVAALEQGQFPNEWRQLSRLADALGATTDAILGRGDPPSKLARADRQLLDRMQKYANDLFGPRLIGKNGWRRVAEAAFLGALYGARDQDLERPKRLANPEAELSAAVKHRLLLARRVSV